MESRDGPSPAIPPRGAFREERDSGYTTESSRGADAAEGAPSNLDVIKKGLEGTTEDYQLSLSTLHKQPCFRQSLLWGLGLGFLFGAHRFKESGNIIRATDWFMGSLVLVSSTGWLLCRRGELEKLSSVRDWYKDRGSGRFDEMMERSRRELENLTSRGKASSPGQEGHAPSESMGEASSVEIGSSSSTTPER